jgi:condensin complex subunit 1
MKPKLSRSNDDMDVDDEAFEDTDEDVEMDVDDETLEVTDEDVDMEDGDATPKQKSKRDGSTKRRKSELNIEALTSEQAALAALDGNQMLSLKLRKKYYSEALTFIQQIENAIPIASQLLGSTHKSEVLEAMEFFRIIHEYKFEGAEVNIFTLHRGPRAEPIDL